MKKSSVSKNVVLGLLFVFCSLVAVPTSQAFDAQACHNSCRSNFDSKMELLMKPQPDAKLSQAQISNQVKETMNKLNQCLDLCKQGVAPKVENN